MQAALHLWDPFLIDNRNMTGNSVEKRVAVWNVIQDVLLTLKPNVHYFRLERYYKMVLFCFKYLHTLATSV